MSKQQITEVAFSTTADLVTITEVLKKLPLTSYVVRGSVQPLYDPITAPQVLGSGLVSQTEVNDLPTLDLDIDQRLFKAQPK